VRRSLGTKSLDEARRLRDAVLADGDTLEIAA